MCIISLLSAQTLRLAMLANSKGVRRFAFTLYKQHVSQRQVYTSTVKKLRTESDGGGGGRPRSE